jgi:hypothetical protein
MTPEDKNMTAESVISKSQTGITFQRELFHKKSIGQPQNLSVILQFPADFPVNSAALSWSAGGGGPFGLSPSKVVSYFVYCEHAGQDSLIGTVPSITGETKYSFIDNNYVNQVGLKRYYIIALMNDMVSSKPSDSVTLFKKASHEYNSEDGASMVDIAGKFSLM